MIGDPVLMNTGRVWGQELDRCFPPPAVSPSCIQMRRSFVEPRVISAIYFVLVGVKRTKEQPR